MKGQERVIAVVGLQVEAAVRSSCESSCDAVGSDKLQCKWENFLAGLAVEKQIPRSLV